MRSVFLVLRCTLEILYCTPKIFTLKSLLMETKIRSVYKTFSAILNRALKTTTVFARIMKGHSSQIMALAGVELVKHVNEADAQTTRLTTCLFLVCIVLYMLSPASFEPKI